MTLGLNTSRLMTVTLGYLLFMGMLFTFVVGFHSGSTEVLKNVNSEELAIYTVLVAMIFLVIGIGKASQGLFYDSSEFWKHLCAAAITANVLVGANNLILAGPFEFLASLAEYFTKNYAIVLIGVTVISKAAYIYLEKTGGSVWESIGQPMVALIIVGGVSSILFAVNSSYALIALAGFLGGFTLHQRQRRHKKQSSSAPTADVTELPAMLRRQAE